MTRAQECTEVLRRCLLYQLGTDPKICLLHLSSPQWSGKSPFDHHRGPPREAWSGYAICVGNNASIRIRMDVINDVLIRDT